MAVKLAGLALRVYFYFGRRIGNSFAKIFRVVCGAQKNYQRNISARADNTARLLLFSNPRPKFFARSGSQHRASTVAAGHFLPNRRVDFFIRAVSIRLVARAAEKIFECPRQEFLLCLLGAPADDNLSVARLGKAGADNDGSERADFLRCDNRRNFIR